MEAIRRAELGSLYGRTRAGHGVHGMEFDYPRRISPRPCMAILAASMVFWYIMIFLAH